MDNAPQNRKDLIGSFHAFLELDVLIPERMRQEIQPDATRSSFEKPAQILVRTTRQQLWGGHWTKGEDWKGVGKWQGGKHEH